jgi:hypothetical protein
LQPTEIKIAPSKPQLTVISKSSLFRKSTAPPSATPQATNLVKPAQTKQPNIPPKAQISAWQKDKQELAKPLEAVECTAFSISLLNEHYQISIRPLEYSPALSQIVPFPNDIVREVFWWLNIVSKLYFVRY